MNLRLILPFLLSVGVVANTELALDEFERLLVSYGVSNVDCSTCFNKIDAARNCLRECNSRAYPGDVCCCCCSCSGNKCYGNNKWKTCTDYGCKWILDTSSNSNKWYDISKYCDCKKNSNNNYDNCNKNSDLRRSSNDRSLLDFCFSKQSPRTVQSIKDLGKCCDFSDNKCNTYFEEVQECLVSCINPCLVTTAADWFDCLKDNADSKKCSRTQCLDGFLSDLPSDLKLDKNPKIFDLSKLEKKVEKINQEDLEDCSLLKKFVDDTCSVGNSCCSKCQSELGSSVDCLLNGVVIPFATAALNVTINECPVDTETCKAAFTTSRELTEKEAELFTKVLSLPAGKSDEQLTAHEVNRQLQQTPFNSTALAENCKTQMETDIFAHNESYATYRFMQCMMSSGLSIFNDTTTTTTSATRPAAANLFMFFGIISAVVFSTLF